MTADELRQAAADAVARSNHPGPVTDPAVLARIAAVLRAGGRRAA